MGEVYLARDTRLGRRVALKFLLKVDAARIARFVVEAQATAQLTHENIVALHDIAEHNGLPYMVLEHVQGKTLAAWLKEREGGTGRRAVLPPSRAAELMMPVARALVCAHEAGIVHQELVTLAAEDERSAFLACLVGAADDASSPLRVIVSVRQDFLDRVAGSHAEFAELLSRGTVLVGPMGSSELRSALIKPAERMGHHFESEALVDEMLDALAGTAGALPLLQFTAARLWEGRDREHQTLTLASYRAFGGVGGALASHADSVTRAPRGRRADRGQPQRGHGAPRSISHDTLQVRRVMSLHGLARQEAGERR